MKSKTFFIYGADFARLEAVDNPDFYFLNRKYFSNPIVIGDPIKGVVLEEINRLLTTNIEPTDQVINIVLNMHGWPDETHRHVLEILPPPSDDENEICMPTAHVLRSIVDATGGKPINIFAPVCYGGNMHAFTNLLPNDSTLITLSDVDKPEVAYDFYNKMTQKMMQSAQSHGETFKYLLPMVALSTKFGNSTPMISKKTINGSVEQLDFPSIANQLLQHPLQPTSFLSSLFKNDVLEKPAVAKLIALIESHVDVSTLKQPPLLEQGYIAWKNGTFTAFKADIEAKYYFLGALDPLKIDFAAQQSLWDMRDEMLTWDRTTRDDFARFAEMDKLIVQGMPCNIEEYYRLDGIFRKYASAVDDLKDLEETAYQRTLTAFDQTHVDQASGKGNMLEAICDAVPNYNILLGVAAAQVVEELF